MPVEVDAEVEQLVAVEAENGSFVPPASDDYRHVFAHDVDLEEPYGFIVAAPNRASTLTLQVEGWSGSGEVVVYWRDPDGERIASRGPSDNDAFQTDGNSDVFVEVAVASPFIEVEISGSGPVNVTTYCR